MSVMTLLLWVFGLQAGSEPLEIRTFDDAVAVMMDTLAERRAENELEDAMDKTFGVKTPPPKDGRVSRYRSRPCHISNGF